MQDYRSLPGMGKSEILNHFKTNRLMVLVAAVFFVSSCAHKVAKKQEPAQPGPVIEQMSPEELQEYTQKTRQVVSHKISKMVAEAKAMGEDQVFYLANDLYLKASASQYNGDFETANIIFEELLKLETKDPFLKKRYAISLIKSGELAKASEILADLHGLKPKDHDLSLVYAGVLGSLNELKKSRSIYQRILKADAANEDACIFLSKSYSTQKNFKRAIAVLDKCDRSAPKKGIFSYYIGKAYIDQNQLQTSLKYFKRSMKKEPGFSEATVATGLVYEELGKTDRAIKLYKSYLDKNATDILILRRIVELLFEKDALKEVVPYAERLTDLEPDNLNLKVKLGIIYADSKEYDRAIRTFRELLTSVPGNDKLLYYLGTIYQEKKNFELAIESFGSIKSDSPLYQDSSLQMANMLSKLAQHDYIKKKKTQSYEDLVGHIKVAVTQFPDAKVDYYVIWANFYEKTSQYRKSIETLNQVRGKLSINHKYFMAMIYEKVKDFKRSTEVIESILALNPKDPHAWNFLGYSLVEREENMEQAFAYIQKAIELAPNDGYIRDTLGWYYYKTGKIDSALKELNKAVRLVQDDISIQKHLAIVYAKKRELKKAQFHFNRALSLVEEESERAELMKIKDQVLSRLPASN